VFTVLWLENPFYYTERFRFRLAPVRTIQEMSSTVADNGRTPTRPSETAVLVLAGHCSPFFREGFLKTSYWCRGAPESTSASSTPMLAQSDAEADKDARLLRAMWFQDR